MTPGGTTSAPGRAAVVVVGYGSADLLARNLAATDLVAAGAFGVVVDNSARPADREATRVVCERHGWRLVARPDNPGFGAAVNVGARLARELGAVALVLLNPDARLDTATLAALVDAVVADPRTAVSPRVVTSTGRVEYAGSQWRERDGAVRGIGPRPDDHPVTLDATTPGRFDPAADGPVHGWLTGACLAVHAETFAAVGGFDERFFLYWEDLDLSHRLAHAGVRLTVRLDLTAVHDEGGTHGGDHDPRAKSDLYYRWNCRNRLVFAALRLPRRTALRWVLTTPVRSREVLLRGGRRQLLRHPGAVLPVLRGSLAGVGWVLRRARTAPSWEARA